MPGAADANPTDPDDPVQSLVAACIEARASGGSGAVEALLAQYADLASQARQQLAFLQRAGLLDATAAGTEPAPESVGAYRILEPLGHGGMGTVYLAEQREPVRRKVALKLIRAGMDTREVVTRFGAERQALALMNHANIALVLDAGVGGDGRPFFVMEYVPGLPITEYCDRHRLTNEQRLALLLAVCDGVQHAHHKGIVHRDLKPSNVLVAEQDGRPVPKIIDFGVAKAVTGSLTDATLHTVAGMVIGTPEYMSPEQAGRGAIDIDTRSDVYSLGVLMYELLTGTLPFEATRLRTDFVEMQRILREEDPRTPSHRLRVEAATAATAARCRATEPAALERQVRGDLDWICLKALEKERDRRYATANDLAADIRRYLADEPVLASPPSTWYRLRKFARRNRGQIAALAVVLLALVAGLGVSLHSWQRARDAATSAEQALRGETEARAVAEANFGRALDAVDRLLLHVASDKLADLPQMEEVRRAILDDALAFYRGFLAERKDDPRTLYDAARARVAIAGVCLALGDGENALDAAGAAVASFRHLLAADGARLGPHVGLLEALGRRAQAEVVLNRGEAARATYDMLVRECEQAVLALPRARQLELRLAGVHVARGEFLRRRDVEAALADYDAAIDGARRHADADEPAAHRLEQRARFGRSVAFLAAGRHGEAEAELSALRQQLENARSGGQLDEEATDLYARTIGALFFRRYAAGDLDEAERLARLELEVRRPMATAHPRLAGPRSELALAHSHLGIVLSMADKAGSEDEFRACVRDLEQLADEFPASASVRGALAKESLNLATHLLRLGVRTANDEAIPHAQRAVDLLEQLRAGDRDSNEWAANLGSARTMLANLLLANGREREALPVATAALETASAQAASHPDFAGNQVDLADAALVAASAAMACGELRVALAATDSGCAAMNAARATSDEAVYRHTLALLLRVRGFVLAMQGDHRGAAGLADEVLRLGAGDRRMPIAAGDVLRMAAAAAQDDPAARAAYGRRACQEYATAEQALDAELEAAPDNPALLYHRACARLGRAELELEDAAPDAVVRVLAPPLQVLRPEFDTGSLEWLQKRQVRAGLARSGAALCALGRFEEAFAQASDLAAVATDDAEFCLRAAELLARCAQPLASTKDGAVARAEARRLLRHALDAGCPTPPAVDPYLEALCRDEEGRALLQRLRGGSSAK
ncbi:MAG: serine/threonine-protein kinase [Planctomycetota bacterium]